MPPGLERLPSATALLALLCTVVPEQNWRHSAPALPSQADIMCSLRHPNWRCSAVPTTFHCISLLSPVPSCLQADIMFSLRHPNCVQLMGTVTSPPCLVTEFCSRGSLTDCLKVGKWHARC